MKGLRANLRGELLQPGDESYDGARLIWNGMFDKKPAVIVRCSGTADIIHAVNFARENRLLTAVRCGGHNSSGSGSCDGGIMIDLSRMNAVRVDPTARRAWVQGGTTWGDFDREAQVHGLATPGGVVSATGVGGLTLAGGLGDDDACMVFATRSGAWVDRERQLTQTAPATEPAGPSAAQQIRKSGRM
jgi:hypothetical protein